MGITGGAGPSHLPSTPAGYTLALVTTPEPEKPKRTFAELLEAMDKGELQFDEVPQPEPYEPPTELRAFRMQPSLLSKVLAQAEAEGLSFSEYVRRALSDSINRVSTEESEDDESLAS